MNTIEVARAYGWTLAVARPILEGAPVCEHGLVEGDGSCAQCGLTALLVQCAIHHRVTKRGYRGGMCTD